MSDTLTSKGWPRPVHDSWPIPWVSPAENLGTTSEDRMAEVVKHALCQVCGEQPERDERVYLFVSLANGPEPDNPNDYAIRAMDNAVLHERCVTLALAHCPSLRCQRQAGNLVMYRTPWRKISLYRTPWRKISLYDRSDTFLGVDGTDAERVPLEVSQDPK